jgi:hypothetical protein
MDAPISHAAGDRRIEDVATPVLGTQQLHARVSMWRFIDRTASGSQRRISSRRDGRR